MGSVGTPNHWPAGISVSLILFDCVIQFRAVSSIGLHFMPYVQQRSGVGGSERRHAYGRSSVFRRW